MIRKCNLCNETKPLQKKCHIIPDFFYRENNLYHEKHNLVYLNLKALLKNGDKKIISSKQKSGDYDLFIFCEDCDKKIIGKYESYAREFLFAKKLPHGKGLHLIENSEYIECYNADYTKLKLLFLSILWRASLSERKLFSEIVLGEEIKEKLRIMILLENAGRDTDFPVFFMNTSYDKNISNDYLLQPIKAKIGNENGFLFAFGGFFITYTIGIDGINETLLKYRVQENGVFRVLKIHTGQTWNLINEWFNK